MKTIKKAEGYVDDGNVFPILKKSNFEYWCVEGGTGTWEVKYDIQKDEYFCNCPNVRLTPCAHKRAVMIKKGDKNGRL